MFGKKFYLATILMILLRLGETPEVEAGPLSAAGCIIACCGTACATVAPACECTSTSCHNRRWLLIIMATVNRLGLVAPGRPLCLRRCGGLSDDGRGWVRCLRLPLRGSGGFSTTLSDQCYTRQSAVVNINYYQKK